MKVRLVFHLPRQDRLPACRLHLHPFEGRRIAPAKLAAHYYPVYLPGSLAGALFAATLQCSLSVMLSRSVYRHPMEHFP